METAARASLQTSVYVQGVRDSGPRLWRSDQSQEVHVAAWGGGTGRQIRGWQVYCARACVRRRLGGSEFLLWVCVMCVGCGIWAGERDLLVWGVGRPGRTVTHLSECGRVYLGGGDFLVQDIQRKPYLSSESKEVPRGLHGTVAMAARTCVCLSPGGTSLDTGKVDVEEKTVGSL